MKTSVRIVAAVLVVAVAGALIAPYFVGKRVERRFREAVAGASGDSDLSIELTRYDRGWFHAAATIVVVRKDTRVVFDNDIDHGPLPGLKWATIVVHPRAENAPAIQQLFEGAPLTVAAAFPVFGNDTFNVESPAAQGTVTDSQGNTARIAWSGLTGHLSDRDHRAALDVQAPSLTVESGDTRLVVGDIRIEGTGRSLAGEGVPDDPADWRSNGRVSVGQFRIADKRDGRELSFSAHAGAHLSADDADGLAYRTQLALDDVHLVGFDKSDTGQPFDIDTLGLSLSLTGLKTAPLQAMMAKIREFQDQLGQADKVSRGRTDQQIGMIALSYLPKILAGSPVLTLELPPAKTSHGTLGARIEAALAPRGDGAPDMASQPLVGFLQRIALKGNAFTDSELADWLISRSRQPAQAHKTLRQLIDQNLLVAHDGRISAKLYADIKALLINGQPMPPDMRQGLLAAVIGGAAAMAAPGQ